MKKVLLLSTAILCITAISYAQKWSAGYRTGLQQLDLRLSNKPFGKDNMLWHNQVFLDRKLTKRLEAELTLGYSYKNNGSTSSSFFDGPALINTTSQTSTLTAGLYLRYYICQHTRLQVFGQAGITSYKSWTNYQGLSYDMLDSAPNYFSGTQNSGIIIAHTVAAGIGFNYKLNHHFYLNSLFNLDYNTQGPQRLTDNSSFSPSVYAGIGFRF